MNSWTDVTVRFYKTSIELDTLKLYNYKFKDLIQVRSDSTIHNLMEMYVQADKLFIKSVIGSNFNKFMLLSCVDKDRVEDHLYHAMRELRYYEQLQSSLM